ncbi:MAG: hypothetical protein U0946_02185 [Patescibacteria group bacterium]|nr:hypothetical protein [Patescibacteria group bacterium]
MNTTIIQVPVSKSLRNSAVAAAAEFGFSSIQESIRVFLKQLANKKLTISFAPKTVQLSPQAAARYDKMIDDIESGKEPVYKTENIDDLLDQLYGKKNPVQSKIS